MINLSQIADRTLPKSKEKYFYSKDIFDTDDIIQAVKSYHKLALSQTKELAAALPGKTVIEYCRNLFNLLYKNVKYTPDIIGTQYVQLPAEVWNGKICDCKSFSMFIATTLQNKGIPFKYRFVSYVPGSKKVTHVYVVVPTNTGEIILDVVYKKFNKQKQPFYNPKEMKKNRLGLHVVGAIGASKVRAQKARTPFNFGGRDVTRMSETEMDLWIARDRTKIMQDSVQGVIGIGSTKDEQFNDRVDILDDALDAVQAHDGGKTTDAEFEDEMVTIAQEALSGIYSIAGDDEGESEYDEIGRRRRRSKKRKKRKAKRKARKVKRKAKRKVRRKKLKKFTKKVKKTKLGKFIHKTVVKPTKALVKLATYPQRKLMEVIMKKKLPKSAANFLYLYIPKNQVSKFPKKVQQKREKQLRLRKIILKATTMKKKHFMGICRNAIIKKYKKEPERVIADMSNGKKVKLTAINGINYDAYHGANHLIQAIGELIELDENPEVSINGFNLAIDDSPNVNDMLGVGRIRLRRGGRGNRGGGRNRNRKGGFSALRPQRSRPVRSLNDNMKLQRIKPRLRKAAPNFLYLFLGSETFKLLPVKVRNKRRLQELLADAIVSDTKMSRGEFMTEARQGIRERYGREPEAVLTGFINGTISGDEIGLLASIVQLLNSIMGLFKKKDKKSVPKVTKDDLPDSSDFGETEPETKKKITTEIKRTPEAEKPGKKLTRKQKRKKKKAARKTKRSTKKTSRKTRKHTRKEERHGRKENSSPDKPTILTKANTAADTGDKLVNLFRKTKKTYSRESDRSDEHTSPDIEFDVTDDEIDNYDRGGSNFWSSLN